MPTNFDDLRSVHRSAVQHSVTVVNQLTTTDLDRPTPCRGWSLFDLLAHMTVQHHGFAAAARGAGADLATWDVASVEGAVRLDPTGSYAAAADAVLQAFATDGLAAAPFALPEFGPEAVVPGELAVGFHLVDYVVHGWDVAATLGLPYEPPADVIAAALPIALAVPDGDIRLAPLSPFKPSVSGPAGCDLDRILRQLGRDPRWSRGA